MGKKILIVSGILFLLVVSIFGIVIFSSGEKGVDSPKPIVNIGKDIHGQMIDSCENSSNYNICELGEFNDGGESNSSKQIRAFRNNQGGGQMEHLHLPSILINLDENEELLGKEAPDFELMTTA